MEISVGQPAPSFTLTADDGVVSLDDYRGRRLVLYFYPKDDTPGCANEAIAFRDFIPHFTVAKAAILGVSCDTVNSHAKFRAKFAIPFRLGCDEKGTVAKLYGVKKKKKKKDGKDHPCFERSTFLIDEEGVIRAMWAPVKVAGHAQAVLEALQAL